MLIRGVVSSPVRGVVGSGFGVEAVEPLELLLSDLAAIPYAPTGLWLGPEGADGALVNQMDQTEVATVVGSPTYQAGRGYSVSSGNYLNTGVAWSTLVAQNDALIGVYTETDGANGSSGILGNAARTTVRATLRAITTNAAGFRINSSSGAAATVPNFDARGLLVGQRTGSGAIQYFKNGAQLGTDVSNTSTTPPTDNLFIGLATNSDTRVVNAVVVGPKTSEQAALNAAIRRYMVAKGVYADYWPFQVQLSAAASVAVPDVTGSPTGRGFTNTGLAALPSNQFLVGDDGRYGRDTSPTGDWRPKMHVISDAGSLVTSIDVYALDGSASTLQGVAVNGDGNYVAARTSRNKLIVVSPAGSLLNEIDFSDDGGPNGLAYDSSRNELLVAGSNSVATIYRVDPSSGETLGYYTLPSGNGSETIDHLSYDAAGDRVLITKGVNGAAGRVLAMTMGAVPSFQYLMSAAICIEGVALVGSNLWVCNDEYYHEGTGANEIKRYALP